MRVQAPGQAFLALWNGVREDARAEYETWHAIEHVPERTAFAGFIETWRYRAIGPDPGYFTCYWLESLDALATPLYRDVLARPSAWSMRMRGLLNGMVRMPCEARGAAGVTLGACALVLRVAIAPTAHATMTDALRERIEHDGVVSAHWGGATPDAGHPFAAAVRDSNAVAMLHGVDRAGLAQAQGRLLAVLRSHAVEVRAAGLFELIQIVRHGDVATADGNRRPPRDDLLLRHHETTA